MGLDWLVVRRYGVGLDLFEGGSMMGYGLVALAGRCWISWAGAQQVNE
ncbi:hypothetical protein [Paenibacillus daejeonensis]|nr:hypothetical protein [Paenibacillus daejeonensis]